MNGIKVVPFLALVFLGALHAATPVADATGVWLAADVPYAPWVFELRQSGTTLTGSVWQSGAVTTVASVDAGTVDGNEISFEVTGSAGSTGGTISFKGVREGDAMVFSRTPSRSGSSGDGLYGAAAVRSVKVMRLPPGATVPSRPGAAGTSLPAVPANKPAAVSASAASVQFTYRGVKVDVTSIQSRPDKDSIAESIRAQIDLIDADVTDPRLRAFFSSVPFVTAANPSGLDNALYSLEMKNVTLTAASFSRDKPIVLHEMMHAYHHQKLPGGMANPQILQLFQQAKSSGRFPADAYMLSNVAEYFAMMSSVYLHGSAAREPFTRAAIKAKQPDCYAWLVKEFGPK